MNTLIIGVAGGTGSGKTTIARKLCSAFRDSSTMLSHDYYYKNHPNLSFEEKSLLNYDHPNALETHLLISHLKDLKAGKKIRRPSYNFEKHQRDSTKITITPKKIIVVEGILIFENKELRDMFDMKIFVDTSADVRFIRRLRRDVERRGRNMNLVINQYLSTVKIMHDEFVEPYKKYADIIIPEGGNNNVAMNMLIGSVIKYLN